MIIMSAGASVRVRGFEDAEHLFIRQYIPLAHVEEDYDRPVDATVTAVGLQDESRFEYPDICIPSVDSKEIIAMAGYALRRACEERGVYSLSSSAAAIDDKGIVFFGAMPDLGKTRLAMTMGELGYNFISDERTLLKDEFIVGGIQYLRIRKDWQQDRYSLSGLVHAGEMFNTTEQAKLSILVYPTVNNDDNVYVEEWNHGKAFWHMQEEMSRSMRGATAFIGDYGYLAPSLDTLLLSEKRIEYAQWLSKNVACFHVAGRPQSIIDFIEGVL